ncbi:DUF4232 domain-containing protein [Streptomyces sp. NPDC048171]|uniref:DUF4232 domain-containing protein n=1 Tax=unclassified Streptomyces TaxID=2593676 RepID=UPI00136C644D|nr:DUF4232 domain-containing protein [Streptomyces sp. SID5789]MZE72009.1 DUF4232 domain-containing protein [Streptomyces sp. SID5789]
MSARTTRTRLFAAATVALAALSLTACEGDGVDSGAPAPAPAANTSVAGNDNQPSAKGGSGEAKEDTGQAPNSGNGNGANAGSAAGAGAGEDQSDPGLPGRCSASDVRITAANAPRPINHLLLTATNTGSKTCALPEYPAARFGEAQSVPPVAESSKPQSLTTLAPGESGYAGVRLSSGDGSGEGGYDTQTLTIPFEDGSIARVTLPSDGVFVDSALTVTYWQTSAANALEY